MSLLLALGFQDNLKRTAKVQQLAKGWQSADLAQLHAESMDIERIKNLIGNIDASMKTIHSNYDSKRMHELKAFFQHELRKRGYQTKTVN